jgi:hypothetical protein
VTRLADIHTPLAEVLTLGGDEIAAVLSGLGDSATVYWRARSIDELGSEMRVARRMNWPVRYQIARSLMVARGADAAAYAGDAP